MENSTTESSSNLVVADDEMTDPKANDLLKEVILTVPISMQSIQSVLPIRSPASLHSQHRSSCTGPVCRICHEDETQGELISPCECSGSLGLVHSTCIEKWLSSSNTTVCEICKYQFSLLRRPKSLYQWLHSPNAHNGPSGFYGDVVCLVLLTPLCVVSVYLCAIGAKVYINHGLWEGTGLAMLCCFLMAVYMLWCCVTVRFHWKRLRRWQTLNQTVRLLQKFRPQCSETCKNDGSTVVPVSAIFSSPVAGPLFHLEPCGVTNPAGDFRPS